MKKHDMQIEIAAPASEVWKALSTGQGISSWFAPGTTVEPGAGGKVRVSWGEGMEFVQRIEIWEPDRHLRLVGDRPEPAQPHVVDYTIESRGGVTVLRLVHSGFDASADFDAEYESTGIGWLLFLQMLKHSAEQGIDGCRNVTIMRMVTESAESAWDKLKGPVSAEFERGVTRHSDQRGHWCVAFPERGGNMVSLFCDSCGGATAVTLVSLLYNASDAEADGAHQHWTDVLNQAFGQPAAA